VGVLPCQGAVDEVPHGLEVALVEVQLVGAGHGEEGPAGGAAEVGVLDGEVVDAILDQAGEVVADGLDRLAHEGIAGEEVVAHQALGPDVPEVEGIQAEVRPVGVADAVLDEELADGLDRVETADVADAVFVDHSGPRRVALGRPVPGEVLGQVGVDVVDDVDLGRVPCRGLGGMEVLRVAGAGELDEELVDGVVLVVAPVDMAFAEPVAPVHGAVVAFVPDGLAVGVVEVPRPGVVLGHGGRAGRRDVVPDSGIDGLLRVGGRE